MASSEEGKKTPDKEPYVMAEAVPLRDLFPKELERAIGAVCLRFLPFHESAQIQTDISIVLDDREHVSLRLDQVVCNSVNKWPASLEHYKVKLIPDTVKDVVPESADKPNGGNLVEKVMDTSRFELNPVIGTIQFAHSPVAETDNDGPCEKEGKSGSHDNEQCVVKEVKQEHILENSNDRTPTESREDRNDKQDKPEEDTNTDVAVETNNTDKNDKDQEMENESSERNTTQASDKPKENSDITPDQEIANADQDTDSEATEVAELESLNSPGECQQVEPGEPSESGAVSEKLAEATEHVETAGSPGQGSKNSEPANTATSPQQQGSESPLPQVQQEGENVSSSPEHVECTEKEAPLEAQDNGAQEKTDSVVSATVVDTEHAEEVQQATHTENVASTSEQTSDMMEEVSSTVTPINIEPTPSDVIDLDDDDDLIIEPDFDCRSSVSNCSQGSGSGRWSQPDLSSNNQDNDIIVTGQESRSRRTARPNPQYVPMSQPVEEDSNDVIVTGSEVVLHPQRRNSNPVSPSTRMRPPYQNFTPPPCPSRGIVPSPARGLVPSPARGLARQTPSRQSPARQTPAMHAGTTPTRGYNSGQKRQYNGSPHNLPPSLSHQQSPAANPNRSSTESPPSVRRRLSIPSSPTVVPPSRPQNGQTGGIYCERCNIWLPDSRRFTMHLLSKHKDGRARADNAPRQEAVPLNNNNLTASASRGPTQGMGPVVSSDGDVSHCCEQCGATFPTGSDLSHHLVVDHPVLSCLSCNLNFGNAHEYRAHKVDIHKYVECRVCHKLLASAPYLKLHMMRHAPAQNRIQCTVCGKSLGSNTALKQHMESHHSIKQTRWLCNICNKTFATKSSLNTHRILHSPKKPFTCPLCQNGFATKSHFQIHVAKCDGSGSPRRGTYS